jgi:small-conductance mechanosensitive channel
MVTISEILGALNSRFMPLMKTVIVVILILVVFNFLLKIFERFLLKNAKTKKQISNIEIFSKVVKYLFYVVLVLFAMFYYIGSLTGFGITIGLLSAALGFALQRPITGIAAWIMVVVKRPFDIGDRVMIAGVKGDVDDITLTHIYLREVGGIVPSEENSGRVILIPNATLFEQNVINYTLKDEFILDQVVVSITYESNLDKAIKVSLDCANRLTKDFIKATKKEPYARTYFGPSGINVHVRYFAPANRIQEISSAVTKEIFEKIRKMKDIEIAYPHTEIIMRNWKKR